MGTIGDVKHRWRVTKGGWAIIVALAVCALLLTVTTGWVRFMAGAFAAVILLALFGDGVAGRGGMTGSKREALMRERFGNPRDR
jgi:hypothetical protein